VSLHLVTESTWGSVLSEKLRTQAAMRSDRDILRRAGAIGDREKEEAKERYQ